MLTVNTPIPTAARGKVRALVKAHPHWRLFLEAKEIISADAKNRDLIEFALFHPTLVAQIEQLLGMEVNPIDVNSIVAQIEELLRQQQKPRVRVPYRKAA
jgi:hypothetical protein